MIKTTLTANLGGFLADLGQRVLRGSITILDTVVPASVAYREAATEPIAAHSESCSP